MENDKTEVQANVNSDNKEMAESPFVNPDDTFDVAVNYYKVGKKFVVENEDNKAFDKTKKSSKIMFTFRYPNTGDYSLMSNKLRSGFAASDNEGVRELIDMEFLRMTILAKKWNLAEELRNDSIFRLDPEIIKTVITKIRDEIGLGGII